MSFIGVAFFILQKTLPRWHDLQSKIYHKLKMVQKRIKSRNKFQQTHQYKQLATYFLSVWLFSYIANLNLNLNS